MRMAPQTELLFGGACKAVEHVRHEPLGEPSDKTPDEKFAVVQMGLWTGVFEEVEQFHLKPNGRGMGQFVDERRAKETSEKQSAKRRTALDNGPEHYLGNYHEILRRSAVGGITTSMKTAVSIPDEVFEKVERLARRTKRSRSEVFSAALREYIARHAPDEVTDAINRAVEEIGDQRDEFVAAASRRVLEKTGW